MRRLSQAVILAVVMVASVGVAGACDVPVASAASYGYDLSALSAAPALGASYAATGLDVCDTVGDVAPVTTGIDDTAILSAIQAQMQLQAQTQALAQLRAARLLAASSMAYSPTTLLSTSGYAPTTILPARASYGLASPLLFAGGGGYGYGNSFGRGLFLGSTGGYGGGYGHVQQAGFRGRGGFNRFGNGFAATGHHGGGFGFAPARQSRFAATGIPASAGGINVTGNAKKIKIRAR